jgi:hypothetical protein
MKVFWSAAIWVHRLSGLFIWLATFTMALLAFNQDNWQLKEGFHPALGLAILCMVTLPIIGGVIAKMASERSRWNTLLYLRLKRGHRLMGYVLLVLA